MSLVGMKTDYDVEVSNIDADGDGYGVSVNYTQPGLPIVLQAGYTTSDLDYDSPYSMVGTSTDAYSAGVGYFLLDSLLTGVIYQQVESEYRAGSYYQIDSTDKSYGVSAKYVRLLSASTAYNLTGRYELMESEFLGTTDDDWSVDISGDYYFTNLISLGAGIEFIRGDSESQEGEEYLVRNKTFFTHNIGVELEYGRFQAKNDVGEDEDSIQVSLVSHF